MSLHRVATGTVTVIIPAYNSGRYLAQTLESCVSQQPVRPEIIVIDDGSTDNTEAIVSRFKKEFSNIIYQKQANQGQCAARNLGLAMATGEWVWFLDSDDMLFPWSVDKLLGVAICQQGEMAIGQERGLSEGTFEEEYSEIQHVGPSCDLMIAVYENPFEANAESGFSFNSILLRTECAREAGGFDPTLRAGEEFNFNCRLTARCDPIRVVRSVNLSVVAKRLRPDSLAVQSRMRGAPPWPLRAAAASLRVINESDAKRLSKLRSDLTLQIYQFAINAYRNGFREEAVSSTSNLSRWQRYFAIQPRWHGALHSVFGFRTAEGLLHGARRLRDLLVGRG